jgi:NAD(P)-dependent dehydrogenase (short-subunit alcohol dehydrogenase family)
MTPRTIVVTGGSSGIGAAAVELFERAGHEVYVLDRNSHPGTATIRCDLSLRASIDAAVGQLPDSVDVVVNAAGVSGLAEPATVLGVNLYGLRHLTESLVGRMPDGSTVVNVASTAGWYWRDHLAEVGELLRARSEDEITDVIARLVPDGQQAYSLSKAAVVVLTASIAQQHIGRIRCNSVSPGVTQTPLLDEFYASMGHAELDPLTARSGGRGATPHEIADVIVYLTSPNSYWLNGVDLVVDHGAEMAEYLALHGVIPPIEAV